MRSPVDGSAKYTASHNSSCIRLTKGRREINRSSPSDTAVGNRATRTAACRLRCQRITGTGLNPGGLSIPLRRHDHIPPNRHVLSNRSSSTRRTSPWSASGVTSRDRRPPPRAAGTAAASASTTPATRPAATSCSRSFDTQRHLRRVASDELCLLRGGRHSAVPTVCFPFRSTAGLIRDCTATGHTDAGITSAPRPTSPCATAGCGLTWWASRFPMPATSSPGHLVYATAPASGPPTARPLGNYRCRHPAAQQCRHRQQPPQLRRTRRPGFVHPVRPRNLRCGS